MSQASSGDVSASGVNSQEQPWRKPVTFQPLPLIVRLDSFRGYPDVPSQTADTPLPWVARQIRVPLPPLGANLRFQQKPDTNQAANTTPETSAHWRRPTVYRFNSLAGVFQNLLSEVAPPSATPETGQANPSFTGRKIATSRPNLSYLFADSAQDPPPPAGVPTTTPWRAPITQPVLPLVLRFDSGPGVGDVPPPPAPADETQVTWFPRPLRQPYSPFLQRYSVHNPAQDNFGEAGTQMQVFWEYATQYEARVRKIFRNFLTSGGSTGNAGVETGPFPGFVNRQTRTPRPNLQQVSSLWLTNEAQDFNATSEESTHPGYVVSKTQQGLPRIVPNYLFVQATDPEVINPAETNPHFRGTFRPGSHRVTRGLFQNSENTATNAPEAETNPWQQHFHSPQAKYNPGRYLLVRGVNFAYPDTSGTSFANAFILDVSTLSGLNLNYIETPLQEVGSSIQLEWVQDGADQDIQLLGYAIRGVAAEVGQQDTSVHAGGQFILDSSRLDTPTVNVVHLPYAERGRSIQVEWIQSGDDQDLQILGYAVRGKPTERMAQEQS